ncbi:class I SAM-dependent methyltransferase [Actinorhabdospora filicis]|nr:class I SAM-dependent methyltransferase [Actinorhabdospora filicis]
MPTTHPWRLFDRLAPVYDTVLPFFAAAGREFMAVLDPSPKTRFLDLGCGLGALTGPALDRGCEVTAVDAAPAMVAGLAAAHPAARALVGDAQALDLPEKSFDLVGAAFVVHLLPEPARAVAEAHRVLAPGGRFAMSGHAPVTTEAPGNLAHEMDALFGEFAEYLPPEGGMGAPVDPVDALTTAGFTGVTSTAVDFTVAVPDGDALWRWCLGHGYRAFIDDLPKSRQREFGERMRALHRPGAVIRRGLAVVTGKR